MSANASQFNVVSYKIHKPRPKGLSHDKMGPRAVLQLNPKLETVYEKNIQPLINTSVDRRAEKGQAQVGRPRPGRPAPNCLASDQCNCNRHLQKIRSVQQKGGKKWTTSLGLGEAGRPHFLAPRVQPSSGSYTTIMHVWTAWLSS